MTERWERELGKLATLEAPARVRSRIDEGPRHDGEPPIASGRQRVVAAVVAFALFGAAGAFAWSALGRRDVEQIGAAVEATPLSIVIAPRAGDDILPSASATYGPVTLILQPLDAPPSRFPVGVSAGAPITFGGGGSITAELERTDTRDANGGVVADGGSLPTDVGEYELTLMAEEPEGSYITFVLQLRIVPSDLVVVSFIPGTTDAPARAVAMWEGEVLALMPKEREGVGEQQQIASFSVPIGEELLVDGEGAFTVDVTDGDASILQPVDEPTAAFFDRPGRSILLFSPRWRQGSTSALFSLVVDVMEIP